MTDPDPDSNDDPSPTFEDLHVVDVVCIALDDDGNEIEEDPDDDFEVDADGAIDLTFGEAQRRRM